MKTRKMLVAELSEIAGAKLVLALIAMAMIGTCAVAQENTEALAPTLAISGVTASEGDEIVEIANGLNESKSLKDWSLVIDDSEALPLPDFLLEPGQTVNVHLGEGDNSETDLFLNSAVKLSDTAGSVTLMDEVGDSVSSLEYEVQPDGSITYSEPLDEGQQ
ncbi:MAG TPA: lamin tail domain-containing protein [Methanotrichaceae archaeon]|nr:lamin tail domain-containing protein [Methanotrichaceae archaeon]